MKTNLILSTMTVLTGLATSCGGDKPAEAADAPWIVDRFDDIKVIRYECPASRSCPSTRNCWSTTWPRPPSAVATSSSTRTSSITSPCAARWSAPTRTTPATAKIPNGKPWRSISRRYGSPTASTTTTRTTSSCRSSRNPISEAVIASIPAEKLGELAGLQGEVVRSIFDPAYAQTRLNQSAGVDMIAASANNYYGGELTQEEVEAYYTARTDANDPEPISYGLNSRLVKEADGTIREKVWKVGGLYSPAIEKIVYWLRKAESVAAEPQKSTIASLINYYETGDLREFDRYNVMWVKDTLSNVDFVNGFIENYGDPLGRKASWEANVNFLDKEACRRTQIISENAQWFEDNSPVDPRYKKKVVKGVSAKVITVAMLGGDCYPATPIGINLPNADWIRKEYGSKSVTIDNITYAYDQAAHGNGFLEEFMLRGEDRARIEQYGKLADDLHTDIHECLGHGSGQLAPGVKGSELRSYGSTLEEARADLFGLYYLGDPKLVELGLIPSLDVAKAQYAEYVMNGLMTQLARIELGKNVEESHMRNRKLIAEWCYERARRRR